ncbi:MAG: tRNA (guanosine(46)-N7)-methyltransferase TrmB [Spirochaetes bacterium]|nr:tRNA (guanosine(46)-N7)-methyltransferase TrmB [Spirochaetota bacterium]
MYHIRSYVLRQGKITKAQAKAYAEWKDTYCIPFERGKFLDFSFLFPEKEQVVLEIGFGMGEATAELAQKMLKVGFLGIEVHTPGVGRLLWEIRRRNLSNVRIIQADAILVLQDMIPPESLDGVHIFFPDPWPKKRHHKRRLITTDFLNLVASRMKEEAYLYMVTDWEDYAFWIMEKVSQCPLLKNPYDTFAPPIPWRPKTAFEQKGIRAGRKIHEIYLKKQTSSIPSIEL